MFSSAQRCATLRIRGSGDGGKYDEAAEGVDDFRGDEGDDEDGDGNAEGITSSMRDEGEGDVARDVDAELEVGVEEIRKEDNDGQG